jgi:hypothetical protein
MKGVARKEVRLQGNIKEWNKVQTKEGRRDKHSTTPPEVKERREDSNRRDRNG